MLIESYNKILNAIFHIKCHLIMIIFLAKKICLSHNFYDVLPFHCR